MRMASSPVRADCTAMRMTPVMVLVVWAMPELLNEHEDAHDREHADDLDEDVDDVAGSPLVGAAPDEQDEHWVTLAAKAKLETRALTQTLND